MQQQVAEAQSTGNISAMLNLVSFASGLTEDDYMDKILGSLRSMYYLFIDTYHMRPRDMIELVDGMLYLDCKNYVQQRAIEKAQREKDGK